MRSITLSECALLLCISLNRYAVRSATTHLNSAQANDAAHRWHNLSNNSMLSLCKLGNTKRFQNFLQPLLVPRIVGTENHRAVARYLADTLAKLGYSIEWDRFNAQTHHGQRLFANIVATLNPNAPRRLVLACHYESKIMEGQVFIGAIDSAVPCAMLLDLATSLNHLFNRQLNKNYTLQLIFFDGEEAFGEWTPTNSLFGARHLSSLWKNRYFPSTHDSSFTINNEMDRIALFVLLDLLGTPNPRIYNFGDYSSTAAFTKVADIETKLTKLGCMHQLPQMFYKHTIYSEVEDDHLPFVRYGIPVLHFIPLPFPDVWHTVKDNANALHQPTIDNWLTILRVFLARFLGLNT